MSILIKNGCIVTQNKERRIIKGDILIEEDKISGIGTVKKKADEVLDASNCVVLPGLVNTHNHVAMSIMRSVADDMNLEQFLDRTFAIDAKRTRDDIRTGSLLGCLEMLRSGTTTFVDMYYWEDAVAEAVLETGIRGMLGWVILDKEFTTQKGNPIDNCKRFIRTHRSKERVAPAVSLQGVYVCSEETLLAAKELARSEETLCHIHLSETRKEVYEHQKKTGLRPVEWLDRIGFLGNNRVLAAHCGWLTINEVNILAGNRTGVSHCPVSNMKLATGGVAPVPEMLEKGVIVSLGTDSVASNNSQDMFDTMKFCSLLHKSHKWDASILPAQKVVDMATIDAARAIGMEKQLGSIEVGKKADIIIIDMQKPNLVPYETESIVSTLVYSCKGENVSAVVVDGKIVLKDGKFQTVSEEKVLREAQSARDRLWGNRIPWKPGP